MIEIEKEKLLLIREALMKATHPEFEKCGADVCELLTKALKELDGVLNGN